MHYQVGQIVWLKMRDRRSEGLVEAKVTKIGRRWAYLAAPGTSYRVAIGTDYLDGGEYSSPGRVWESEVAWAESERNQAAWFEFKRTLDRHYHAPRGANPENLLRICGILGISS